MTEDAKDEPETSNEFLLLCTRLRAEALLWLGFIPNPETKEKTKDLGHAKATIDTLEMLREKTAGNLSEEESKVLRSLLYDLRMTFVEKSREA
jgi:hypothetical protein